MPGEGNALGVLRVLIGAFGTRTKVTETIIEIALLLALIVGASFAEHYVGKDSMAAMALFVVQMFGYLAMFAMFMKLLSAIADSVSKPSPKPEKEPGQKS